MSEVIVLFVQLICLGVLVAGAALSIWFKWVDQGRSERPAERKPVAHTEAEAVVKPAPGLKRAA